MLNFYDKHPLGFGLVGVGSGLSASAISLLQQIDLIIRVAGGFVALLVSLTVLILQCHKLVSLFWKRFPSFAIASAVLLTLSGCATKSTELHPDFTGSVGGHIERGGQYTAAAAQATENARSSVGKVIRSATAIRSHVAALSGTAGKETAVSELEAETVSLEAAAGETARQLDIAAVQLAAEKMERQAAQADLKDLQAQASALAETAKSASSARDAAVQEAHENAKERDVVLFAFAAMSALWAISRTGAIASKISPVWSWAIQAGVFIASAAGAYAAGRFALHSAAKLIP